MIHPSDDDLLELALLQGEPDAPRNPHVRDCPACAARWSAVLAEQDLLRRAMAPAAAPARAAVPPRAGFRWVAAALFFGLLAGAAVSRLTAPARSTSTPLQLARVEDALRHIPAEIESLRDAEPSRLENEYPRVLSKAEDLYADFLSLYLDGTSPLSDLQRSGIRQAVDALYAGVWSEADVDKTAAEFSATLQTALNEEQFRAFQARLRQDKESDWVEEIDILTDDLAEALNLRFSEEELVREALKGRYPKAELPMLTLAQWPPDRLAGDGALAASVRAALGAGYHPAFDRYLDTIRDGHRRAEKAVRGPASGQGR